MTKTVLTAVFVFFSSMHLFAIDKTDSSPDFAMPRDVAAEATKSLDAALSKGNPVEAIRALINLTVAENLVSKENARKQLNLIDSVASQLKPPYSSVAHLLKAQLYTDIYLADQRIYNNRVTSETQAGEDPEFWNRKLFKKKVTALLSQSLDAADKAKAVPLSDIDILIDALPSNPRDFNLDINSFTLYDFLIYKAIEINSVFEEANVIPFFKSDDSNALSALSLIDMDIASHTGPSDALAYAIIQKSNLIDNENFLKAEIERYRNDQMVIPLVSDYYARYIRNGQVSNQKKSDFYNFIRELIPYFQDDKRVEILKNISAQMLEPSARVICNTPVSSGHKENVRVEYSNLSDIHILLYKVSSTFRDGVILNQFLKSATLVEDFNLNCDKAQPFFVADSLQVTFPEPGQYVFLASTSSNPADMLISEKKFFPDIISVSNIDIIKFTDSKTGNAGCYVVNSSDSSPISGADVTFERIYWDRGVRKTEKKSVKTDKQGYALSPYTDCSISASYRNNSVTDRIYSYRYSETGEQSAVRFFTDLPVYRPGDTVKFTGIVYKNDESHASTLRDKEVKVFFQNPNFQKNDTITLVSDESGRIFGEYQLPDSGLLGTWLLMSDLNSSSVAFQVADYKTDSFFVNLGQQQSQSEYVEFEGMASTYSGMPVMDADVKYTVNYSPFRYWRYGNSSPQSYSASLSTDAEGKFQIKLPLENLDIEKYNGIFSISATVTNSAGESVESPSKVFWLRPDFRIIPGIPARYEITSDSIKFNVRVEDMANMAVSKEVEYEISKGGQSIVAKGTFISPALDISARDLPSGSYTFRFKLPADSVFTDSSVILYRMKDEIPPVETPLWCPEEQVVANKGQKNIAVRFGSSFKGQNILCTISDSDGRSESRWIESNGKIGMLSVDAPSENERKFLTLSTFRDHRFYTQTIAIVPEIQLEKLEITTETFRNLVTPFSKEKWSFKITKGGNPFAADAIALMYNKSLDAIAPLNWNTSSVTPSYHKFIGVTGNNFRTNYSYFTPVREYLVTYFSTPVFAFNTYNYPLYAPGRYGIRTLRTTSGSRSMNSYDMVMETTSMKAAKMEAADDMEAPAMDMAEGGVAEESYEDNGTAKEDLRPIEMPLAFFKPDLSADSEGNLQIDFEVPNFNTTWNFVLFGYTPRMLATSTSLDCVASKEIMVSTLTPRFVRTGDQITIVATLYNNSDVAKPISGKMEIYDPVDNSVLREITTEPCLVAPASGQDFALSFTIPDDISIIGLRSYALGETASDGEQTLIPVLPSSQPVIESQTFYIKPDTGEFSMKLPEFKEDATLTLLYCDNPLWEAVTALPAIIEPDSESLLSIVSAFYANSTGYGIFKNNPGLREGLQKILAGEDGNAMLISKLEQDQELKTVALDNTPWVNNAANETLRLSRLSSLIDDKEALAEIDLLNSKILQRQNVDGGWSWCKDMKSSRWITEILLLNYGLLKEGNYIYDPENFKKVSSRAIKYCDSDWMREYSEYSSKSNFPYYAMLQYLYARSFFPDAKADVGFNQLKNKAIDKIASGWKNQSVMNKATSAILLWREDKKETALKILESLSQFASVSAEKGAWFDNLDSSWDGAGKLLTTARVISAFNEIKPTDPLVDQMRQWLLLQKQAQDWQEGWSSVDVINTLLTAGSDWSAPSAPPVIKIGGQTVPVSEISALTGSCKINLDAAEVSNRYLIISRDALAPAWGGVISQFVAPVIEVRSAQIPSMKIEKQVNRIITVNNETVEVAADTLRLGDKVRVSFIVTIDRDMDFVALTDERSACLSPLDQLSGYTSTDGVGCYREIRNSSTNLFFSFLPKGRHIFHYDCYVSSEGCFSSGIATLQCLYSPLLTAHSAGALLTVSK